MYLSVGENFLKLINALENYLLYQLGLWNIFISNNLKNNQKNNEVLWYFVQDRFTAVHTYKVFMESITMDYNTAGPWKTLRKIC